jgi:hypothetical protein
MNTEILPDASSDPGNRKDNRPVHPVGEMRGLQLTAASTKLHIFHGIGKDSLSDFMTSYREHGWMTGTLYGPYAEGQAQHCPLPRWGT